MKQPQVVARVGLPVLQLMAEERSELESEQERSELNSQSWKGETCILEFCIWAQALFSSFSTAVNYLEPNTCR